MPPSIDHIVLLKKRQARKKNQEDKPEQNMSQVETQAPTQAGSPASVDGSSNSSSSPNTTSNQKGLWGSVKKQGAIAGKRASLATKKAKIRTDMHRIDNKMHQRKEQFGIDLYDQLAAQAEQDDMFIIESNILENIRGQFVTCYKDNKAWQIKKAKKQQQLVEVDEKRAVAYPKIPAETFGGQLQNGCKAANFARQETQYKARINIIDKEMKANKKKFGLEVYRLLVQLEDNQHWLPQDREVRFLYDKTRRDINEMIAEKQKKEASLELLNLEKAT